MEFIYSEISSILRIPPQLRLPAHIENLMKLTRDVQFFNKITLEQGSADIHEECCKVMNLEEYEEEDFIFHFGERGEKFYIILKGSVSVKTPAKKKVVVSKNTVSKIEGLLKFSEESEHSDIMDDDGEARPRRIERNVRINVNDVISALSPFKPLIEEANSKQCMLDVEEKNLLNLFKRKVRHEQKLLMDIVKHCQNETVVLEVDDFNEIARLSVGSSFGELALISDRPRSATIEVLEKSSFLVLSKPDFTNILGGVAAKRLNNLIQFMKETAYFSSRSKSSLVKMAYYFQPKKYKSNQIIYKEGDKIDGIYFIKEGEVTISKNKPSNCKSPPIFSSSPYEFYHPTPKKPKPLIPIKIIIKSYKDAFGGFEIINSIDSRIYSCTCSSATCEIMFLSKMNFLSRVSHLDLLTDLIDKEHSRIIRRFQEISDAQDLLTCTETRILTPVLKKSASSSRRFTSKRLEVNYASKKSLPGVKRSHADFLRKLTDHEISEAINGRSSVMRKYGNRLTCDSSFRSENRVSKKKLHKCIFS